MIKITLKDHYRRPCGDEDTLVVDEAVADFLQQVKRAKHAAREKARYNGDDLQYIEGWSECHMHLDDDPIGTRMIDRELHQRLTHALEQITAVQRRRFMPYVLEGLTLEQIALREGVSVSVVHRSIATAKKKLRNLLGEG